MTAPPQLIDAFNELREISAEAGKLEEALNDREIPTETESSAGWIRVLGFAAAIEKIYSGCERVLELVAKQVDGQSIPKSDDWHRQLLLRMKNEWPDIRPAVRGDETYKLLNDLRSFRHRQRNTYGSSLDPARVKDLANEAVGLPALLLKDIEMLAAKLAG